MMMEYIQRWPNLQSLSASVVILFLYLYSNIIHKSCLVTKVSLDCDHFLLKPLPVHSVTVICKTSIYEQVTYKSFGHL